MTMNVSNGLPMITREIEPVTFEKRRVGTTEWMDWTVIGYVKKA
jgi:hypothetical protein